MFFPEGQVRVHLCGQPVDMRKSYDGLSTLSKPIKRIDCGLMSTSLGSYNGGKSRSSFSMAGSSTATR
jgi:hypothetical protein